MPVEQPEPSKVPPAAKWLAAALAVGLIGGASVVATQDHFTKPDKPLFTMGPGNGPAFTKGMDAASSASMLYDPNIYKYEPGNTLAASSGPRHVYKLVLPEGDGESRAQALGEIFGLTSAVKATAFDGITTYEIREGDPGSALTLNWAGTGFWNYSRVTDGFASAAVGCINPTTSSTSTSSTPTVPPEPKEEPAPPKPKEDPLPDAPVTDDPCVLPPTPDPADLISEDNAKTEAMRVFARAGLPVRTEDLRYDNNGYQASVSTNMRVAGEPIALDWSISWDNTGEIAWASGHSVRAEDGGSFDTVSPATAVARIPDPRWSGAAPNSPGWATIYALGAPAGVAGDVSMSGGGAGQGESGGISDPGLPTEPSPGVMPAEPPSEAPMPPDEPIEPLPTPETITVTITDSENAFLIAYAADGTAWVVPGYLLSAGEAPVYPVIALDSDIIKFERAPMPVPMGAPDQALPPVEK